MPSYSVASFQFETRNGKKIPVLGGKASSIRKMLLTGDGEERELAVGKSRLFFSILKEPFDSTNVEPISE